MQFVWILTLTCFYIVSSETKKTLNDECHTDKYILIYVMRYQLRLVSRQNSLSSNPSFMVRLHKRFLIEEFDHGSD